MTVMRPELRRAVVIAALHSSLGREPSHAEIAQALCNSGEIADAAALTRHAVQWLSRRTASALDAERAEAAVERASLKAQLAAARASLHEATVRLDDLDGQLSSLRGSTSWRLTRPIRAIGGRIPPGSHRAMRNLAGATYRALRRLPPAISTSAGTALPFGKGTNPFDRAFLWCMRDPPVVSIVILNRDSAARTIECIQRVWACTSGIPYDIIVADNGSEAQDLLRLGGLGNGVRIIPLGTDRFFGEANNIAAEAAHGEFICLLGNSVRVTDGWLTSLHTAMRQDPAIAAAAPRFGDAARLTDGPNHASPATVRDIDSASADALLVDLSAFISVGGFDLAYEPGRLADIDLCYKLRVIGRTIRFCPDATVTRLDSAIPKTDAVTHERTVDEVNRAKLLARWGDWPNDTSPAVAGRLRNEVIPATTELVPGDGQLPRAAIFTPYLLTLGGGERVILTLASVLSRTYAVQIVTIHPYSRLRLATMGQEFSLDLSHCTLATHEDYRKGPKPDIWVTLGNHLYPPLPGGGRRNWYLCQFPFPMDKGTLVSTRADLAGYDMILTYSEYALAHVNSRLRSEHITRMRAEVLYPPVLPPFGDAAMKRPMILSVGRFIARGHTKRHDALIDAFRSLFNRCGRAIEFHIVGSSFPTEGDMEYLAQLQASAADIPVTFHVNANKEKLTGLYRDAMFYWHATGYGSATAEAPERAEHFGISIVEAMSAQCVALAFAAGGPCEIIRHAKTGFLFETLDELVDQTAALLSADRDDERQAIGRAASDAARRFSLDAFQERVEQLVDPRLESATP